MNKNLKKRVQTYSGEHRIKERPTSCHIARQPHSPSHQAIRQIYSRWSNGDAGLTGRKIIIDTYGGWGAHGGSAFSGKNPTKANRSAAHICHSMAKSVVASGLSARCLIQLAYAIGVAKPLPLFVDDVTNVLKDRVRLPAGAIAQSLARSITRRLHTATLAASQRPEVRWLYGPEMTRKLKKGLNRALENIKLKPQCAAATLTFTSSHQANL